MRLDGEEQSKKQRVCSKIFKVDENNQYGFVMKKSLPIGAFKKKFHVDMDILNKAIKNIDPNGNIGEIFVVDIEFSAYDDPCKKMYNEVFPCMCQPKSKMSVDRRSAYQLISTMRTSIKNNVLKYKATEKTHTTLYSKKRFPMYIDCIHLLTKRAGWKVTKVHNYYTFEQETFKEEYILGNQKARQDDVQANFWKLLNHVNFSFDGRDNSQKKSLHLICNKEAEIDFISKYGGYSSTNCFLNLDAQIKNIK